MNTEQVLELVRKAQVGDQEAFAALYDEFADRLYTYLKIKTVGTDQAEDLLQDVFMKAWKALPRLEIAELNFSAWLYKITSNTLNDYYRKHYKSAQQTPLENAAELRTTEDLPANFQKQLDSTELRQAVSQLADNYKQVIELRFFQDFSIKETAEILNRNQVIVRVWQHRAVKQLQDIMQRYERQT